MPQTKAYLKELRRKHGLGEFRAVKASKKIRRLNRTERGILRGHVPGLRRRKTPRYGEHMGF